MPAIPARNTGAHVVYAELKRRILSLDLKPGERIYEPAMATALQVSRTPLREAIRRLISENLLEQQPTGGVVVPVLDEAEISELYEVRAAVESLMARNACLKATPADLGELHGILARNAALVEFADDAMQQGMALHARIALIAGNSWAGRFHEQVASQMERYRHYTNSTQRRRDQALAQHRALVEAIAAGDPERAAKVAFEHVMGARDAAVRALSGKNGAGS
ncbi:MULTISPECIES: GntR family transcriptional regulator [Micrococcaceae]|uniref:GntR family transcriptional regulator n=1 Tax=Micrococcaceae TaxID=1268 RepID=UPI0006F5C9E4|nr:GntR family transcriptional regulator [Arthrobacter sp. Leaf137]KQQ89756.1 GntR family transcriptional regulator [Arthrobacter sp. Leaf137]MDQ1053891.1 DNA-binding GntR family transcriptional regulator [Arthrobacter sp. SORGH_AS_0212]